MFVFIANVVLHVDSVLCVIAVTLIGGVLFLLFALSAFVIHPDD